MRITIVVDDFSGGAGNVAQLLALSLFRQGHEINMLLTSLESAPRYNLNNICWAETQVNNLSGNKAFCLFKMIGILKKSILDTRCDLLISFIDNTNTLACFAMMGKHAPVIVSERSNPLEVYPAFPWNILRLIAYQRADVVSVQFDVFKNFEHGIFRKKCMVTHNIIRKSPVHKTSYETEKVSFVSMGRYHEIKRFEYQIRIFASLNRTRPNTELHIFGTGIDSKKLREIIREEAVEGSVYLHGPITAVHEELVKHDIYLMTSRQEGFPNALSEAMAAGLPVIAFKCHEGIAELVHNGENGYCVDEGNREDFVAAMQKLSDDAQLRKRFGQASIEVTEKFDENSIMTEWNECIGKAISARQNI